MKNRTTRFLITSLVVVALLCVCVFSFFGIHMGNQSAHTINQVGTLYMSSMSQQISTHFESIIGLQMNQLKTLAGTVSSEDIHTDAALQEELAVQARARDFEYAGFCSKDGTLEMLYGSQLQISDPQPFLESLSQGQEKVAIGTNVLGEKVILLGVPSPHPPTPEHDCAALVVGFPVEYISDNLALEENSDTHRLKEMLRYLHENFDRPVLLEEVAAAASIGKRECLRCFRRTIGVAPMQYLLRFRVRQASRLLAETDLPITEVGSRCGFESPSYFTLTFRRLTGQPPRDYRRYFAGSGGR